MTTMTVPMYSGPTERGTTVEVNDVNGRRVVSIVEKSPAGVFILSDGSWCRRQDIVGLVAPAPRYITLTLRADLCHALLTKGTAYVRVVTQRGEYLGILDGVQREDGSGRSFNLTINCNGVREKVYWRSAD